MSLQINSCQSHNSKKATTGTEIDSFALLSTYEKIERESFSFFLEQLWVHSWSCGSCQTLQLWTPCGPPQSDHDHKSCYISYTEAELSYHSAWTASLATQYSNILSCGFNKYNSAVPLSMNKIIKNIPFLDNHLCHINFPLVSLDFFSSCVEWTRSTSWAFPDLPVLISQQLQLWPDTKPISILNLHTLYRMCQIQITSCALTTSELTCSLFS